MSNGKSELSPEELAMLAAAERPAPKTKKKAEDKPEPKAEVKAPVVEEPVLERGPYSPAQFDDDGWGDTPVQMRG